MVDVAGAENRACKLLKQVVLFIGRAVGTDDSDGAAAADIANLLELRPGYPEGVLPCGWFELALRIADERCGNAFGVLDKVEAEAAFGTEEVAIDTAFIAVVSTDDFGSFVGLADTESDLAAVRTMGADRGDMVHLPGAGLVAIAAAGESADRTDVDAHAALFAVELIIQVGCDYGGYVAVLDAERPDVHAFAANAGAAVAEDTPRAVIEDGGGPLLLIAVLLGVDHEAFARAVFEGHVLQLALAAGVADRAVERVVAEEEFDGSFAGLGDLRRFGCEYLAFSDSRGAGGLKFGNLFLTNDAHAARGLEAEAGVVAEGGDLDAGFAACLNEQRSCGSGQLLAVDCECYVC